MRCSCHNHTSEVFFTREEDPKLGSTLLLTGTLLGRKRRGAHARNARAMPRAGASCQELQLLIISFLVACIDNDKMSGSDLF